MEVGGWLGSYKMTDDGRKPTNLGSNISPDLFGKKRPNTVNRNTFCVNLRPGPLRSASNDEISIKC